MKANQNGGHSDVPGGHQIMGRVIKEDGFFRRTLESVQRQLVNGWVRFGHVHLPRLDQLRTAEGTHPSRNNINPQTV